MTSKRRSMIVVAGFAILVLCVGAYLLLAPTSPERIRDRAISALEREDAQELCQLADTSEIKRLQLSPVAVAGILHDTLWSGKHLTGAKVTKIEQTPDDQSIWRVKWTNQDSGALPLTVPMIDDQKKGWKLNLSKLISSSCWRKEGGKEGMRTYYKLSKKYGVDGLRTQGGGYQSMETIAHEIAGVFGS